MLVIAVTTGCSSFGANSKTPGVKVPGVSKYLYLSIKCQSLPFWLSLEPFLLSSWQGRGRRYISGEARSERLRQRSKIALLSTDNGSRASDKIKSTYLFVYLFTNHGQDSYYIYISFISRERKLKKAALCMIVAFVLVKRFCYGETVGFYLYLLFCKYR